MRRTSTFWMAMAAALLLAAASIYILVIGKPWTPLFTDFLQIGEDHRPAENIELLGDRIIDSRNPYDTQYGNLIMANNASDTAKKMVETLFDVGYRHIAADFNNYEKQVKELCWEEMTINLDDNILDLDTYMDHFSDMMIERRVEMECIFSPLYEIPVSKTEKYINGTLNVTIYGITAGSGFDSVIPGQVQTGETRELEFGIYILQDANNDKWKVQNIQNAYFQNN